MAWLSEDSVFRHRNYLFYWITRQLLAGARQMTTVAIAWHTYDVARRAPELGGLGWNEANSAFLIGFVGLSQYIPVFFLSLIGGQAADRLDRRKIMLTMELIKLVCATVLCVTPFLSAVPALSAIFSVSFVLGITNAFVPAASNALYPTLVPRSVLPKAVVWNTMGFQIATIGGPAIGGLLLMGGESYAYVTALIMTVCAILTLLQIKPPEHVKKVGAKGLAMVFEGLRYVLQNKIVLGAITLDFVVVFFAGSIALLPVFARDILHVGEEGFGILRASLGLGALIVAIALSRHSIQAHIGKWMFASVILFGIAILMFGMSRIFWLSVVALMIHGGADMISMYIRSSLVQLSTPDDMKGRVSSTNFIFVSASNELGEFQSGVAARLLGPVGAVMLGGCVAIGAGLVWMGLFPALRKADRFEDIEEQDVRN